MHGVPDDPVLERLRIMYFLACSAGYAGGAKNHPIVVLRLADAHEVEEPMMLSQYDAERLVVQLLVALETHGDEFARGLLEENFSAGEVDPNDAFRLKHSGVDPNPIPSGRGHRVVYPRQSQKFITDDPPPAVTRAKSEASMNPVPIPRPTPRPRSTEWRKILTTRRKYVGRCTVQYSTRYWPRHRLFILGGYTDGTSTFILARRQPEGGGQDGIGQILPSGQIKLWDAGNPDRLPDEDWEQFLRLKEGTPFVLHGKSWTKMTRAEITTVAHGKLFKCVR